MFYAMHVQYRWLALLSLPCSTCTSCVAEIHVGRFLRSMWMKYDVWDTQTDPNCLQLNLMPLTTSSARGMEYVRERTRHTSNENCTVLGLKFRRDRLHYPFDWDGGCYCCLRLVPIERRHNLLERRLTTSI